MIIDNLSQTVAMYDTFVGILPVCDTREPRSFSYPLSFHVHDSAIVSVYSTLS